MQARKAAVEKDLVRARKMAKDLLDERVVVSAESEQQMENLNVSMTIVFGGQCATCYITGALHCVGKVNGVQTAGCPLRGAPEASAGPGGRTPGSQNSAKDTNG